MANKKQNIKTIVERAIADVRRDGDKALVRYAARYDRIALTPRSLRIPKERLKSALETLAGDVRKAIEVCARRIQDFHYQEKKRLPESWTYTKDGVRAGQIFSAIDAVGVYVPGGRFAYPSTVLMAAIPARLAGSRRVAMVTPPARLSAEVLAAAAIAGVDEVYQVGGPAAVAALAVGTKSIPKVDLIVGPGNALVTEAKRQLFGEVGIDLLAGPSELVVIADDSAVPGWVAADMAAQAEHDPDSRAVLISLSRELIAKVKAAVPAAVRRQCEFYYEPEMKKAALRANAWAGEHVEIVLRRPQEILDSLKNGGAFFMNSWSPAVLGDYWAGPSHVLPTGRSARFASGLSVLTFLKRSSFVEVGSGAFKKGWAAPHRLAQVEGLAHHARALAVRVERSTDSIPDTDEDPS